MSSGRFDLAVQLWISLGLFKVLRLNTDVKRDCTDVQRKWSIWAYMYTHINTQRPKDRKRKHLLLLVMYLSSTQTILYLMEVSFFKV